MKKKILMIVLANFMIMGVVSAASMWGTYKGNQIIKLTVDHKPIKVSDVPAISYNGRTMVPIYLLKEAGISYTWDPKSQTVNLVSHNGKETILGNQGITTGSSSSFKISDISREMKKVNVEFVEYVSDGKGFNSIGFYYDYSFDNLFNETTGTYLDTILQAGLKTDATIIKIVDKSGSSMVLSDIDLRNYYAGKITGEELIRYAKLEGTYFNSNVPSVNTDTGAASTFNTITSRIDGDFEGFESDKIFKLLNGQIWQQTSYDYKYSYKYSPEVTIYKDGSTYYMIVDGIDKKVKVKQLK